MQNTLRDFFVSVLVVCTMVCIALASAAPALAQVGIVRTIEGQVRVFSGRPECAPRHGLDVDEGDVVRTGEKSWALLTMMDGARIIVRPDTEVRLDAYRYTEAGESAQNRAEFTLRHGAVRVTSGRIAGARNSGVIFNTPDASMDMRGTDSDVAYITSKFALPPGAQAGTYGKSFAGDAVLKNPHGEVTLRAGQSAYTEPRDKKLPRILPSDPYFYHWYSYIDRRVVTVLDQLEAGYAR